MSTQPNAAAGSGWRPPQWGSSAPLWSVTRQDTGVQLFFDGVRISDHYFERVYTKYPIQSGASVSYHSYQMQDRVILEVGFFDTMQSYDNGQYSSSVDAFNQFVALMKSGTLVTLTTRLYQYPTMGIHDIRASDDYRTNNAAKFAIVFEQLIIAGLSNTQVQTVSNRPNTSQDTSNGSQQASSVPPALISSHTGTQPAAANPDDPNQPNPNPSWNSDINSGYAAPGYTP